MGAFFDRSKVKKDDVYEILRAGWHRAKILDSKVEQNSKHTGMLVKVTYESTKEPKRRVWQNINFKHELAKTQEIGERELDALLEAVGFQGSPEYENDLHRALAGKELYILVSESSYQGRPKNEVEKVQSVADYEAANVDLVESEKAPF